MRLFFSVFGMFCVLTLLTYCGRTVTANAQDFCHDDVKKYRLCGTIPLDDEGGFVECLHENRAKLSQLCQSQIIRMQRHYHIAQACAAEITSYCPDPELKSHHQNRGLIHCLEKHGASLTKTCHDKLQELKPAVETEGGNL